MRRFPTCVLFTLAIFVSGCATYQDELSNGQRAFEASEHERALAIFRGLEPDAPRLSPAERARYAYLRGMTDYRIGYKADARHWLAVALAVEQQTPGSLPADWLKRSNDAMKELNEEVYSVGIEALSNVGTTRVRTNDEPVAPDNEVPAARPGDSARPAAKSN